MIVFDAAWISAFFGGLTLLVAAMATAYSKIRRTQFETKKLVNSHLTELNNEISELNGMIHDLHERISVLTKGGTV